MSLDEFCRRQWRNRTDAVREHVERRKSVLAQVAGPLSDQEKINRESEKRILRAKGAGGTEGQA